MQNFPRTHRSARLSIAFFVIYFFFHSVFGGVFPHFIQEVHAQSFAAKKVEKKSSNKVDFGHQQDERYVDIMEEVEGALKEGELGEEKKNTLLGKIASTKSKELQKLRDLGVDAQKIKDYEQLLNTQEKRLKGEVKIEKKKEVKMLDKPSSFSFAEENKPLKKVSAVMLQEGDETKKKSLQEHFKKIHPDVTFEESDNAEKNAVLGALKSVSQEFEKSQPTLASFATYASTYIQDADLPVVNDIREDSENIIINNSILELAKQLDGNPTDIFNFVREHITYEPYFGAKKGSDGCLKELRCNDTDTSSLTIALLRASGIPARYKTTIAVMDVEQLKSMLAVDETKTVYAALDMAHVPVYLISGNVTENYLQDYDFTNETHLAVGWTFVELFFEYDERAANHGLGEKPLATSTDDLRTILKRSPKKQWVPMDALVQEYIRNKGQIIVEDSLVNFDAYQFLTDYLQGTATESPFTVFEQLVESQSGKDINSTLSSFDSTKERYGFLPTTLPYVIGDGTASNGVTFNTQSYTELPVSHKHTISLKLFEEDTQTVLFNHTLRPDDINDVAIELTYKGATETDQSVIASYEGLHQTPASLVSIVPELKLGEGTKLFAENSTTIGSTLILEFKHNIGGQEVSSEQKYSIAGNSEGIALMLTDTPIAENNQALYGGNAAIAREYLHRIQEQKQYLQSVLDYGVHTQFAHAVVTQNRIVNEMNGIATTFTFKGLSIDAATNIYDYSRRGDVLNHRKDFRLLWGMNASYHESQVFKDVTGMDAISTVTGLQRAYADPATYTVHTLNTTTPNYQDIVSALSLSENTKTNVLADITNGNTVIIPDTYINAGTWGGLVYMSLDPTWGGLYAIGEQVGANGGFTISDLIANVYDSVSSILTKYYYVIVDSFRYTFVEKADGELMNCRMFNDRYDEFTNGSETVGDLGLPCYEGIFHIGHEDTGTVVAAASSDTTSTVKLASTKLAADTIPYDDIVRKCHLNVELSGFTVKNINYKCNYGQNSHVYKRFTDGTRMFRANEYNFEVLDKDVETMMDNYLTSKVNEPEVINDAINLKKLREYTDDGYKFKFSGVVEGNGVGIGTYIKTFCEGKPVEWLWLFKEQCANQQQATMYFVPQQAGVNHGTNVHQSYIVRATGRILEELGHQKNWFNDEKYMLIEQIGWPTSEYDHAAPSAEVDSGRYQSFVDGQIYMFDKYLWTWVYYTIGGMTKEHNLRGGTGSQYGFPQGNPEHITWSGGIQGYQQKFEDGWVLEWDQYDNGGFDKQEKYECGSNAPGTSDLLKLAFITAHGVFDTAFEMGKDAISFILNAKDAPQQLWELPGKIRDFVDKIKGMDWDDVKAAGESIASSTWETLQNQYDLAVNCYPRQAYITGRLLGEVLVIVAPFSKIKAVKAGTQAADAAIDMSLLSKTKLTAQSVVNIARNIKHAKFKGSLSEFVEDIGKNGQKIRMTDSTMQSRLQAIRSQTDPNIKGADGEQFVKDMIATSNIREEVNVPALIHGNNRRYDLYDVDNDIYYEVKARKNKVSASGKERDQLDNDVLFRDQLQNDIAEYSNNDEKIVWVFLEEGPTKNMRELMEEGGIQYIIIE